MKKILVFLFSMVAIAVLFAACSKSLDKLLDRKDGKWNLVSTGTVTVDGVLEDTYSSSASITFEESTFMVQFTGVQAISGTWGATKDKVTLIVDGDAIIFDVISSKKNSQEWESVEKITDNGVNYEYKTTWKLTK